MPQTFNVLRCVECEAFQVQLEKKASKWQCSLCGARQSLQRIYATSSKAKDCRELVQQYNSARGAVEAEEDNAAAEAAAAAQAACSWDAVAEAQAEAPVQYPPAEPKWAAYAEEEDEGCAWGTVALPTEKPRTGGGGGGSKRKRQEAQGAEELFPEAEGDLPSSWVQDQHAWGTAQHLPHAQPQQQPLAEQPINAQHWQQQHGCRTQALPYHPPAARRHGQHYGARPQVPQPRPPAVQQQRSWKVEQPAGSSGTQPGSSNQAAPGTWGGAAQHAQQQAAAPAVKTGGKWGAFAADTDGDW